MLYLLKNCHNCHKRSVAFYWVVYWVTLSEYVFNSAAIWKRKWKNNNNKKKTMNLTKTFFFLCCIYWDGIAHFQLPNLAYLRVACGCTFLLYINRITICIMNNLGNIKVRVTLTTRKAPSPNMWQAKFTKFLLHFFLFKRERGSCHSLGTCLWCLW